ncbi:MAG: GNAT family N-acetyltransferase [Defluviitaleaceae bacterium]|nr:GNAT family N-acetyltransferase [Defluviitaleaceae bacterium]
MEFELLYELDSNQIRYLNRKLEEHDDYYIKDNLSGDINIGIKHNNQLIAGVISTFSTMKILYVSTIYVDDSFRKKGLGKKLMKEVENKAIELGAELIRIDTFEWQAPEFYTKLGYEQVGYYENKTKEFSEYFFVKYLH